MSIFFVRKPLFLLFILFLPSFAYHEFNLYANLGYGTSNLVVDHAITVEESGYYIPEYDANLWVTPYYSVESVKEDSVLPIKFNTSNDYVTYRMRHSVAYGEWYRMNITLKPKGVNPVIYANRAYFYFPLLGHLDNLSILIPPGWKYLYNVSDKDGYPEVLIYSIPTSAKPVVYNYTGYTLNISEYENTFIRVATKFYAIYTNLSKDFGIPLKNTKITSMPPEAFEKPITTLAHFKLDTGNIEYNLKLDALGEKDALQTLTHELIHALSDQKFSDGLSCTWFSEGLAEYNSYSNMPKKYNFTEDFSQMKNNFNSCICRQKSTDFGNFTFLGEDSSCGFCDTNRLPYDQGYLFLKNLSVSCNFEPCLMNYYLGGSCQSLTDTLAVCCGDLTKKFNHYKIYDYDNDQPYLYPIYQKGENCSELALSSYEIKTTLLSAIKARDISKAEEVPRMCNEFSLIEKLADTQAKKDFLINNAPTKDLEYLKTRLKIYDRYTELKARANNLRCIDRSILNQSMISVFDSLNNSIDDMEALEEDLGKYIARISIITNNKAILEKSKTAWRDCNFDQLQKLKKRAKTCENLKGWGFWGSIINFFTRTCP